MRVRKWLIVVGALVLAPAVAVTIWAFRRSDGPPTPTTPAEAVEAACHASGASQLSPASDPKGFGRHFTTVALPKDLIPVYWDPKYSKPTGNKPVEWEAAARATSSGSFEVVDCKVVRVIP